MTSKESSLYKNMYTFWKQGNSLEVTFQWLKDAYGSLDSIPLMTNFLKNNKEDTALMKEFNSSSFIENIHIN